MTFHVTYVEFHHTISEWFRTLVQVECARAFAVVDIVEPESSPDVRTTTWSEAPPYKIRMIPSTIIWKARKPNPH